MAPEAPPRPVLTRSRGPAHFLPWVSLPKTLQPHLPLRHWMPSMTPKVWPGTSTHRRPRLGGSACPGVQHSPLGGVQHPGHAPTGLGPGRCPDWDTGPFPMKRSKSVFLPALHLSQEPLPGLSRRCSEQWLGSPGIWGTGILGCPIPAHPHVSFLSLLGPWPCCSVQGMGAAQLHLWG